MKYIKILLIKRTTKSIKLMKNQKTQIQKKRANKCKQKRKARNIKKGEAKEL